MRQLRGRDIAMIFQEPMTSLNPVLRIGLQIMEPLLIHLKMSEAEARARAIELLTLVGITDPASRLAQYPHQLSGGMRQRVMIAIGLACNPKLLIADEPTTALDVTIQAQILELMKDLSRRLGVAVVIITHNLGIVARYADRVNVMYAARLVESGNAETVFGKRAAPLCARTAVGRAAARPGPQRQARHHRRGAAQSAGAAGGLPVPPALPVRHRQVPGGAAAGGGRARPPGRLLPQARSSRRSIRRRHGPMARRRRRRRGRHADPRHSRRQQVLPRARGLPAPARRWCAPSTTSRSTSSAARRWGWWASPVAASPRSAAWCCGSTTRRPARSASRISTSRSSSAAR